MTRRFWLILHWLWLCSCAHAEEPARAPDAPKTVEEANLPPCGSRGPSQDIFRMDESWFFWDDGRCFYHGPYVNYEEARKALKAYAYSIEVDYYQERK